MKTLITSILLIAFSSFLVTSCSKDKDVTYTKATILVVDNQNLAIPGIVVYAYNQDTWNTIGEKPLFAQGQAASDANGKAEFSNIEYPTTFTDINNNQNTFRFSAHYNLNGVEKTKVIAITFNKGDQKTETLTLD